MNKPILRLYEDVLQGGSRVSELPPLPRMIFVLRGVLSVEDHRVVEGEAWHGQRAALIRAGKDGATCWRFELAMDGSGDGSLSPNSVRSNRKLAVSITTLPEGELLLRGDSVAFPPGGCAYLHRHQGPGIRCLLEGAIRIDTQGRSTSYGAGEAWYEAGPDPVFAQAAMDRPTRFIRFMILPRALLGKSSIQYLDEADKTKPRLQQYRVYADEPITDAGCQSSEIRPEIRSPTSDI